MVVKAFSILFILLFTSIDPVSIPWSDNQKLTWNDFIGKHDPRSPYAASTHSSIVFSYNVSSVNENLSLTTEVNAYFYPEMSWFNPNKANEHILKHEQAHFDITEIHARKLREAFANYTLTKNFEKELTSIFTKINHDRKKMQDQFDMETNHSLNFEEEATWQKFISEELRKLENFMEN